MYLSKTTIMTNISSITSNLVVENKRLELISMFILSLFYPLVRSFFNGDQKTHTFRMVCISFVSS